MNLLCTYCCRLVDAQLWQLSSQCGVEQQRKGELLKGMDEKDGFLKTHSASCKFCGRNGSKIVETLSSNLHCSLGA